VNYLASAGVVAERQQVMQSCSEHCVTCSRLFANRPCFAVLSRISMKKLLPVIPTVYVPLFVLRVFHLSVVCKNVALFLERLSIYTVCFCMFVI
jgi:hypothetical protein